MAYKTFVAGEEALAADVNNYLMSQTIPRFANAAARTAAITSPVLNQLSMRDDRPGIVEGWNGSAWVAAGQNAEIAYAQVTAAIPITSTSPATGHLIVNSGAITYDGSPILVEFYSPHVIFNGSAGQGLFLYLADGVGTADIGNIGAWAPGGSPASLRRKITPTAGSHSYLVGAYVTASTGNVMAGTGATGAYSPAFIRITRA